MISQRKIDIVAEQRVEKIDHARALNGDAAEMRTAVRKIGIPRSGGLQSAGAISRSPFLGKTKMSLQPRDVFIRARRVDDEEKFLVADSVRDQVINDPASVVEQKSILPGADIQLVDVIRQHRIEPVARAASIDNHLSHVRNVEHADVLSHGAMFFDDARVLHWHEPAAKSDHLRAAPHMLVVKRSAFLPSVAHHAHPRLRVRSVKGGSCARRATLNITPKADYFCIELAVGRVRPLADKGLLDPP